MYDLPNVTRHTSRTLPLAMVIIASAMLAACGRNASADAAAQGREVYSACAPCHGERGEGWREVGAPALGGMPAWYIEEELREFRSGIRGAHPDDVGGMRMRPMVRGLMTDDATKAVSLYAASLPAVQHPVTVEGSAEAGQKIYEGCAACHGESGAGNEDMKSAPVTGMEDWYLELQLKNFRDRVRGYHPDDPAGTMMQSAMEGVTDQQIRDVVAYIRTLK